MKKEDRVLSIRNMEVKFRVRSRILTAIRNVSFDVYDQEVLAIVGESGSGKSVITKTFTGMLESNGWISQGSIVYRPNHAAKADPKAYFKEPVDLVNLQKPLISNEVIRFVSRRNNKKIKKLQAEIKKYYQLNPLVLTDDNQTGIDEATHQAVVQKNLINNSERVALVQAKLEQLQGSEGFTASNRVFNKIAALEGELQNLAEMKKIITDQTYRDEKIEELNNSISHITSDTSKVKPLSVLQKMSLKKIISIVDKYIKENEKPTSDEVTYIKNYFDKRQQLLRFESELKEIVEEVIKNQKVDQEHFLNILNDWARAANSAYVNKMKANKEIRQVRGKTISTIFQDPMTSLNPLLSVGFQITEVLRKQLKMNRAEAKTEAIELLRKVGITNPEKRFHDIPGRYSGGMRQRVVIAIALACRPKILICDEPTTALDVTIQAQILKLVKELQKEYKFSVIFITHDLGVVASIADRIAVMYAGQIIEIGTTEEIFNDPKHPYTWALLSSLPQLGTKGKDLFSIAGTPPSLFGEIKGDAFAPRNKFAMKIDYEVEPPMFEVSPTHSAKTWLLHHDAPKINKPTEINNLKKILENPAKE